MSRRLRILFSVRKSTNVRHYEPVLRALAARGHHIDLVKEPFGEDEWPPFVLALANDCPEIHLDTLPAAVKDRWWELAMQFQRARFYLRFLGPAYRETPALVARARRRAPHMAVRIADGLGRAGQWLLRRVLPLLEQSIRTRGAGYAYLKDRAPDLIVLTPLLVLKTVQPELAHAAAELGIRTMFAVASWDHLSSKAALDCAPQQVVVWNAVQAREAIELHGVDADRIVVTGSQLFDEWFTRRPATSREAFCARVGLRPDRPIVLYVGSSLLEASTAEPAFAARWARALRNSGSPVLWDCGILVRPHYERGSAWRRIDLAGLDNIACWPKVGDAPVDARSRADFFDSMYHAAAVVGLNTSAMIEAAIVGRPVHTVLLPEFHDHQEGTVHFHYLLEEPAALLRATRSLDDHARQLAHVLEGRDPDPDRSSRFVQRFVRPRGLGVPATQWFVEAVEALADRPAPAPVREPAWFERLQPIARWLLRRYADAAVEQVRRADEASRIREAERLLAHRRSKAPVLSEHRRQRLEEHRRRKRAADAGEREGA